MTALSFLCACLSANTKVSKIRVSGDQNSPEAKEVCGKPEPRSLWPEIISHPSVQSAHRGSPCKFIFGALSSRGTICGHPNPGHRELRWEKEQSRKLQEMQSSSPTHPEVFCTQTGCGTSPAPILLTPITAESHQWPEPCHKESHLSTLCTSPSPRRTRFPVGIILLKPIPELSA